MSTLEDKAVEEFESETLSDRCIVWDDKRTTPVFRHYSWDFENRPPADPKKRRRFVIKLEEKDGISTSSPTQNCKLYHLTIYEIDVDTRQSYSLKY